MPLDSDLNAPYNNLVASESLSNMPLDIDLNVPSSSNTNIFHIDLNLCPLDEEEAPEDEFEAVLSNNDVDDNIDDIYLDEVHAMIPGTEGHTLNEGGERDDIMNEV